MPSHGDSGHKSSGDGGVSRGERVREGWGTTIREYPDPGGSTGD